MVFLVRLPFDENLRIIHNFKTFMAVGLLAAGSKVIKNYNSKIVFVPFMKLRSFE